MNKKNNRELAYRILKPILVPIFRLYYNPKYENTDYIHVDGPVVICGNHKHIMDQCLPISNSKRVIHYMSKREYFDGPFAWFFKSVGCIPVDRSIKDTDAKQAAIDTLMEGKAIGIFPEGTRNGLKDDVIKHFHETYFNNYNFKKFRKLVKKYNPKYTQVIYLESMLKDNKITIEDLKDNFFNVDSYLKEKLDTDEYNSTLLIPLKYGAVSMAKKTDATIIPYAIVGDYKFRSKNLKVIYGKPFKVTDMELEDANNLLTNTLIELMNK